MSQDVISRESKDFADGYEQGYKDAAKSTVAAFTKPTDLTKIARGDASELVRAPIDDAMLRARKANDE